MDPVSIGVAFLLGVLTAGAGALFQAQITDGRRDRALRRALRAEIDENIQALEAGGRVPLGRSAWEAARALTFDEPVFGLLAAAYRAAAGYDIGNAIVNQRWANARDNVLPLGAASPPDPRPVLEAFVNARDAL
jgi:type II secretory pathway pseudopilin PulG